MNTLLQSFALHLGLGVSLCFPVDFIVERVKVVLQVVMVTIAVHSRSKPRNVSRLKTALVAHKEPAFLRKNTLPPTQMVQAKRIEFELRPWYDLAISTRGCVDINGHRPPEGWSVFLGCHAPVEC